MGFGWVVGVARVMITSSNGNIFRVTGPLCGEFTGHQWIPRTKASGVELSCFFICAWINGWVNNRKSGDLRRHRTHYDVIVMVTVGRGGLRDIQWVLTCTTVDKFRWSVPVVAIHDVVPPAVDLNFKELSLKNQDSSRKSSRQNSICC